MPERAHWARRTTLRASGLTLVTVALAAGLAGLHPGSAAASTSGDITDVVIGTGHSNMCLGISGGSRADGAQVIQYACNGRMSQRWLVKNTGVIVSYQNRLSSKCMDVSRNSTANGARIVQYRCQETTNQHFVRDVNSHAVSTEISGNEKCLDVKGASQRLGAPVVQFTCNGHANQRFDYSNRGDP